MKNFSYLLIVVILGVFSLSSCQGYNNMVEKQEAVTAQWGNVENAYQRRADLIPNLVATVKGYAEHEQETFRQVTEARAKATQITVNPEQLTEESLQISAGTGSAESGAGTSVAYSGKLPRTKSKSKFSCIAGRTCRYRKPNFGGKKQIQSGGSGLQCLHPQISAGDLCRLVQIYAERVL